MPDTTPGGYPYALPADPLVNWPATSQSLAEKLEALKPTGGATAGLKIAAGTASGGDATVTFPPGLFTAPPAVVVVPSGGAGAPPVDLTAGVGNITAQGFQVAIRVAFGANQGNSFVDCAWIAVGI
jgi:hypothetical protein